MKAFSVIKVLFATYLFSAILLVVLSFLLYKFGIGEDKLRIGIMAVYCLSGLFGGFVMGKVAQTKKYLWGILTGVLYFIILLAVSIALNGSISQNTGGIIMQLALCMGGGMLGGMLA